MAGDTLAVVLFVLLALLTVRQRRTASVIIARVPLWQDVAKIVGAGVILAGVCCDAESYGGIPVPVLLLLALLGVFTCIATQTVFGRRFMRWVRTSKRRGCPA